MTLRNLAWSLFWIVALAVPPSPAYAVEKLAAEKGTADPAQPLLWYDIRLLGMEGQGWTTDLKAPYDRLPAKAEGKAPASVWGLSHHSAGLAVRFVTDARTIQARWTLIKPELAMPHMPATGVSGLDLYVKDSGNWRWLSVGQPRAQTNTVALVSGLPAGEREYMLYLPLYNGVSIVELGIDKGAFLAIADPRPETHRKPILFYGTSITQGGCASRPGMVHTAILGRHLNYPVINLGFSGSGRMEAEMADLLAEVDPAVYVLDCLPNMDAKAVSERVVPFVKKLRAAHPQTPILLVEDRTYSNSFLISGSHQRNQTNRAALEKAYQTLLADGIQHLAYLHGEKLLGADGEDTVDGSHPTDLGFLRQAEAMEPALKKLLNP